MPLSGGTSGAHDDSMHQGSAKRDVAEGLAGLDVGGHVLAPGYRFTAARGAAEQITIRERTSDERVVRFIRIGANDYEARVNVGGVEKVVQHAGMKDVVNGIAALDAAGALLVPGSKIYYTRDGSDDVHIYERTSNEEAYAFHRVGADDYTLYVKESNVWKRFQTESMKDIANGIAGLDGQGYLLVPGYSLKMARSGTNHIYFNERTADESYFQVHRSGIEDFEVNIHEGASWNRIQTSGMKNIANGIAGLDANAKLGQAQVFVTALDYFNNLGIPDALTLIASVGNGSAVSDAANYEVDISSGTTLPAHGHINIAYEQAIATGPMVCSFIIRNIINGIGGTRYSSIGLAYAFDSCFPGDYVSFYQNADNSWVAKTCAGGSSGETVISPLANDDFLTIKYVLGEATFYVNGVLVATRTANLPTGVMRAGAAVCAVGDTITTARSMSIKHIGSKMYV